MDSNSIVKEIPQTPFNKGGQGDFESLISIAPRRGWSSKLMAVNTTRKRARRRILDVTLT